MKIVDIVAEFHENQDTMQRIYTFKRDLKLSWIPNPVTGSAAVFLWGPRQTGKTTLLERRDPVTRARAQ